MLIPAVPKQTHYSVRRSAPGSRIFIDPRMLSTVRDYRICEPAAGAGILGEKSAIGQRNRGQEEEQRRDNLLLVVAWR